MRQLLPVPVDDVDPLEVHGGLTRAAVHERPWVVVNMVASADGGTALDGVSGGLGGDGDRAVFGALRTVADAVLVASGTVAAERYGPPSTDERRRAWRTSRGMSEAPRIAVVTGSLGLDPDLPLFAEGETMPWILTVEDAPVDRRSRLADRAEIIDAGRGGVDLVAALATLHQRGVRVVLAEGGPGLLGQLADLDLIDELCLTLAPALAGGDSRRIVHGATAGRRELDLDVVLEHEGELFLRYVRRRDDAD